MLVSRRSIEDSGGDIGVSVGGVATLFDNRLQVTYGWMLSSATEKRAYWGLGFSFVRAVKDISSGVASVAN